MTHPASYHRVDLSLTPRQAVTMAGIPSSVAANLLRNKRVARGVTRDQLLREQIEPLIMRHGVTIDEAARKFDLTPARVCRVMGWL